MVAWIASLAVGRSPLAAAKKSAPATVFDSGSLGRSLERDPQTGMLDGAVSGSGPQTATDAPSRPCLSAVA